MYLKQKELAAALKVSPQRVSQATRKDQTTGGLAVRNYADIRTNGHVAEYRIPESHLDDAAPAGWMDRVRNMRAQETNNRRANRQGARENSGLEKLSREGQEVAGFAEAVNNNATAVSANVSAAGAVASLSGAVRENPEIMEHLADLGISLGTLSLMIYATDEETHFRVIKVIVSGGGMFTLVKLIRHWTSRDHRRVDMLEQAQQAEIERQRERRRLSESRDSNMQIVSSSDDQGHGTRRVTQNQSGLV